MFEQGPLSDFLRLVHQEAANLVTFIVEVLMQWVTHQAFDEVWSGNFAFR
jgi:hypothetical protein